MGRISINKGTSDNETWKHLTITFDRKNRKKRSQLEATKAYHTEEPALEAPRAQREIYYISSYDQTFDIIMKDTNYILDRRSE